MTRMEWLQAESLRLDDLHDRILAGETVGPVILVDQVWDDNTGCIAVIPSAPAAKARKRYLGKAWCGGVIAKSLHSDSKTLFNQCPHCRK